MAEKTETKNCSGVDKGLVAMFLKISPEERLRSNDNAARTILDWLLRSSLYAIDFACRWLWIIRKYLIFASSMALKCDFS